MTPERNAAARRANQATGLVFLLSGAMIAAWAPLVPLAKARLQLDEASLGALLLCMGLGALASMPFAGALARRFGFRYLLVGVLLASLVILPSLAWLGQTWSLALALFVFGMTMGVQDVTMNVLAVEVEKAAEKPLMSGFHGRWSVGTIVGAGMVSGGLSLGVGGWWSAVAVSLIGLALTVYLAPTLPNLPPEQSEKSPRFVLPKGSVLVMGALCLVMYLVEHSVLDWSAVYMVDNAGANLNTAGWAYTVFAAAMTACRLTGDFIRQTLGDRQLLLWGGLLSVMGLLVVTASTTVFSTMVGYLALGAGAANIVPVLFSLAGNTKDMPPTLALTAVASMGYFGALGGPAVIGFMAKTWSLPVAFAVLSLGLLAVAACHRLAPAKGVQA